MYYIKTHLLLLFAVMISSCYAILSITSPSSNSDIVAGSTISVTWTTTTNNSTNASLSSFDIQLKKYIVDLTTNNNKDSTTAIHLASNIQSNINSYSVTIPANLSTTTSSSLYVIVITEKNNTMLASTGPLQLVLSTKGKTESMISEGDNSATASISMGQSITSVSSLSTMSSAAQSIIVVSPPTTVMNPINNTSNHNGIKSYLTNEDTNSSSSNDIGPTLSSAQVAGIALGIVGGASLIFGIYILIKWIIKRRRSPTLKDDEEIDYDYDDDASSQQSTQLGGYSSSNNSSIRSITEDKKRVNIMENINEEEHHYDSLYYGQHFTEGQSEGGYHLTPSHRARSPSPALRISTTTTDNHAFGRGASQQQQQLNSNTYHVDIPVPPSTYRSRHHHHSESTSSSHHHIDIDIVRRPSLPITTNNF